MTEIFPKTLQELQEELLVHSKDGRSDAGFRLNIVLSQMGNLAAHFTHDPVENPTARPYGTPLSEVSDCGHAILQLCTYCALRGVDIQNAVNVALGNLRERDFIKREALGNNNLIIGQTAMTGILRARVVVAHSSTDIPSVTNDNELVILVCSHPSTNFNLCKFAGIITDHGGMNCHAAIIAREYGIPCIVGTGNASLILRTGDIVEMNADLHQGQIKVITNGN